VGELLRSLRERYGNRLDISVVDPRNILALWDNIRYGVRASKPAWILDRKKIGEGVLNLTDLQNAIDEKMQMKENFYFKSL
jgi:hypothetical protein